MTPLRTVWPALCLWASLNVPAVAAEVDSLNGKSPDWGTPAASVAASVEPLVPYVASPFASSPWESAAPFTSLQNAVDFIHHQRRLGGRGLPATFNVPSGVSLGHPLRQLLVSEGVGLYDTALAVIVLVEAGDLPTARQILDVYAAGSYGSDLGIPMELCARPSLSNGGAFSNFDADAYYFFDFTNVYGDWSRWRTQWAFWGAHTGPNAWMVNALLRFVDAEHTAGKPDAELAPYIDTAKRLAAGFLRLQDAKALGGVRYGPETQYVEDGLAAPYEQINSENNLSTYVSLRMLHRLTGDALYEKAAARILDWFQNAPVWTSQGERRQGLFDPLTSTLAMGAEFHKGRWILQPDHPTDSEGTWAISSLGPEKIDALWGAGSAYRMWQTIRQRAGRTDDFKWVRTHGVLAGLDYTDAFPEEESLISPEWTAGGLFALQQLRSYYAGAGKGKLTAAQWDSLQTDARTMSAFIRHHSTSYALGPGHHGQRQGRVGFGWIAPPEAVEAMPSTYLALYFAGAADPSAWWRKP